VGVAFTLRSDTACNGSPPKAALAEGRPKGTDAPLNQSREAHRSARPLHSPE